MTDYSYYILLLLPARANQHKLYIISNKRQIIFLQFVICLKIVYKFFYIIHFPINNYCILRMNH